MVPDRHQIEHKVLSLRIGQRKEMLLMSNINIRKVHNDRFDSKKAMSILAMLYSMQLATI